MRSVGFFILTISMFAGAARADLSSFPETTYLRVVDPGVKCSSKVLGITASSGAKADGSFPVCALKADCNTIVDFKEVPAKTEFSLSIACRADRDGCPTLAACAKTFSNGGDITWIEGEISKKEHTPRGEGVSCQYADAAPRALLRKTPSNKKEDSVDFDEKNAVCMEMVSCVQPENYKGLVVCKAASGGSMKDSKPPECPTATDCYASRFPVKSEKEMKDVAQRSSLPSHAAAAATAGATNSMGTVAKGQRHGTPSQVAIDNKKK